MYNQILAWVVFNAFVIGILILDLGVFHKKKHVVGIKEASFWTISFITLALLFSLGIYYVQGSEVALQFLTGYIIEKSLSIDNLFVFLLIFTYFRVPDQYIHKVLFWGILGALVMRILFIFAGVALIQKFHWMFYVFGLFLVYTAIKLAMEKDKEIHPEQSLVIRIFKKFMPVTQTYVEDKFFIVKDGKYVATLLFVVLLSIETTDVIFALDSIPAILAITTDPFIVYTSNIFAILGLRSIYFVLAHLMKLFHFIHYALAGILLFVGVKMLIGDFIKIPVAVTLGVIVTLLAGSVIASIMYPQKNGK